MTDRTQKIYAGNQAPRPTPSSTLRCLWLGDAGRERAALQWNPPQPQHGWNPVPDQPSAARGAIRNVAAPSCWSRRTHRRRSPRNPHGGENGGSGLSCSFGRATTIHSTVGWLSNAANHLERARGFAPCHKRQRRIESCLKMIGAEGSGGTFM